MAQPKNWKRKAAAAIARLSTAEAKTVIERVSARGATISHPEIKELTGGYVSQHINAFVMRKLGVKAGIVKNPI